ncbi:MAG: hypothetical protein P1P64_02385 [Treponemataceae bacterium]
MFKIKFSRVQVQKLILSLLYIITTISLFPQNTNFVEEEALVENTSFQITEVDYVIDGLTMEKALRRAVYVDTNTKFSSKAGFNVYLKSLLRKFQNIRTLESVKLETFYKKPNNENLSKVKLVIHTKDSFNFIILPYPKYDSNSGFSIKLKAKDNNFVGTMLPLNLDLNFENSKKKKVSSSLNFSIPYKAGPLFASQSFETGFEIDADTKKNFKFNLGTTVAFSYAYKFLKVNFGLMQGFVVNESDGAYIGKEGYKYYLVTKPFISLPLTITNLDDFGSLVYTPSFYIQKDWSFSKEANANMKGCEIGLGHSIGLGQVSWRKNFREGLSFNISNDYLFKTFKKGKPNISLSTNLAGYINFFERFGIYSRMHFFYNFNKVQTTMAGQNLRGISNNRINTDLGLSFNLDMPIKIFSPNFSEITERDWTRFFSFELQLVPFLDFAFVHDVKTGRYFSPKDMWCSGGLELIVYPEKFHSIYVRASLGFDLRELKNVPGLIKLKGTAKRDGKPISEIFIGIGLHY